MRGFDFVMFIICILHPSFSDGTVEPGGGGVLDQYLGMGEPLRVWNPDPV